jgi:hypothetical protein
MKKKIIAISLLSLSTFACVIKKAPEAQQPKADAGVFANFPIWVLDPRVEGKVAAVGISSPSKGGIKVQLAQAETDARANIAQQIRTELSRITKDSLRKANVDNNEAFESSFSQATKEVVKDVPLSGAVRQALFVDPKNGDLYVHVIIDQTIIKKYLEESMDTYSKSLQAAGATRKTIDATEQAMSSLFNELDLERAKKDDTSKKDEANTPKAI